MTTPQNRLSAIDSLRGIAAILVVLFHFTTRYQELYGHTTKPTFYLPWGHFGVNLFFMISGFVIFLTLERTRNSLDFVVSRFSRLYPAFWAAVALTFLITHWLALPGKLVSGQTALVNLTMIHSFFNIASVDNVYWTLEVELLFYVWAFLAFRLNILSRVHLLIVALFMLRLIYYFAKVGYGIDLPWLVYRLLILKFIPWFAAGIMVYRLANNSHKPKWDLTILICAVGVAGIVDGGEIAVLLAALCWLLHLAASDRLRFLNHRLMVGFGTISYTLYLLHENIGWAIIRQLELNGIDANVSIAAAFVLVILMATVLTLLIEQPVMRWIRNRYKTYVMRSVKVTVQPRC